MMTKRRTKNDVYIVGTYLWAMAQLKKGERMHRRGWAKGRVLVFGEKPIYHPTIIDKKNMDWEVINVIPAEAEVLAVEPVVVESALTDQEGYTWIGYAAIILLIIVIVGGSLYINGHY
jgi:hypothetical protein